MAAPRRDVTLGSQTIIYRAELINVSLHVCPSDLLQAAYVPVVAPQLRPSRCVSHNTSGAVQSYRVHKCYCMNAKTGDERSVAACNVVTVRRRNRPFGWG